MEHREEMNCGGDLCKEMLELDKLLRASDSEEMMGGTPLDESRIKNSSIGL